MPASFLKSRAVILAPPCQPEATFVPLQYGALRTRLSNSCLSHRSARLAAPLAAVAIAASTATGIASGPRATHQQTFAQKYVTVVGLEGRPVTGLGSEDFSLRDGGVRRPVQAAEPATQPLAIAVVIAGFETADAGSVAKAVDEIRRAVNTAGAGHRIDVVDAGARSFLEAALEASDLAAAASTDRRIVLALVRRRAGDGDVTKPERLTDALRAARASLWTLEIAVAEGRDAVSAGGRRPAPSHLDDALTMATQIGGGLRETLASASVLPDHAARVARLLLSQYIVTYAWPDPMIGQFSISTRHDRGTVLSPVWDR